MFVNLEYFVNYLKEIRNNIQFNDDQNMLEVTVTEFPKERRY